MSDDSNSASLNVQPVDEVPPRRPGAPPVAGMAVFIAVVALLVAAFALHRTRRDVPRRGGG